jgi:hypothetical protein
MLSQQMQEFALYHVRRCQPSSGVGDQNFIQLTGGGEAPGLGAGWSLQMSIVEPHGTPIFLERAEPIHQGPGGGATAAR